MEKDLDLQNNQDQQKEEQVVVAAIPKKEKKKTKKRLFLLILLLLATGVMLGTSTYAWFTSNETVQVNNIQVSVSSANGIQISVDALNWKSVIEEQDITGAVTTYPVERSNNNQLPDSLQPVSTGGILGTNGYMQMYLGTIDDTTGNFLLVSELDTESHANPDGNFIAFDLFLRVDEGGPVYVNSSSGVTFYNDDTGIKQATRIAFVTLGHSNPGVVYTTTQALLGTADSAKFIWEPNYNLHNATGIANAQETYDLTVVADNPTPTPYSGLTDEFDVLQGVLVKEAKGNSADGYFSVVTPDHTTRNDYDTQFKLFDLVEGVTKVRVYMWVEGQDVDCENSASGGTIIFNLSFTTRLDTPANP